MRILVTDGEETELAVRFTDPSKGTAFRGVVRGGLGVVVRTVDADKDGEPIYMEFSG